MKSKFVFGLQESLLESLKGRQVASHISLHLETTQFKSSGRGIVRLQISLDINRITAGIWEEKREDNLAFKEIDLGGDKRGSSCCIISQARMLLLEEENDF